MPTPARRDFNQYTAYRLRLLGCTAGALVLLIGIFRFWPLPIQEEIAPVTLHTSGQELIAIEEIQPTRQSKKPPPPPPPVIPSLVPDDILIENEIEFEDAFLTLDEYGDDDEVPADPAPEGASGGAVAPEVGPKPLRFVEPEYTREARRKNVKAEIVVEVLVDARGRVETAKIIERFLYSKDAKNKTTVESLEYGLEESALSAAERWTFRPARQNGTPVESYTTLTFSFGV